MTIKRYKFIEMRWEKEERFNDQPVYRVHSLKNGDQLAMICWYKPWKKYVFTTKEGYVFDNKCLRDILEFMETVIPNL